MREIHSATLLNDETIMSKDLYADIIESPDRNENYDDFDMKQTSKYLPTNNKGYSIFHCNIRSLGKNLNLLNDILLMCKEMPSFIAISETKLSDNSNSNISIPGYRFLSKPSQTSAGGVGIYINNDIEFIRRWDIEFDFEGVQTCFIEIPRKQKNLIIGCVYRHPSNKLDNFHELLSRKLDYINNSGYEAYVTGDFNVNFLNYTSNKATSDYLDMLFALGYIPLITKATRITYHSKTLIDHIYTNSPEKVVKSGICLAELSDHLPCFCTISSKLMPNSQQKYYRDYSNFENNKFIEDLHKMNFMSFVESDINKSMNNIVNTLQSLTDKHAPIRKASNTKKRQLNSILRSIKKRQKLFKTHYLSGDPYKVRQYKIYNNKLNKVKSIAKKNYFEQQFAINKNNIKTTWELIGMIINRDKKKNIDIPKLIYNNKCYVDK
jgi:hypothetical protein